MAEKNKSKNNTALVLIIVFLFLGIVFFTLNKPNFLSTEKDAKINKTEQFPITIPTSDITVIPTAIPSPTKTPGPPFDYSGCVNTVKNLHTRCVASCYSESEARSQACPKNDISAFENCLSQSMNTYTTCLNSCQNTFNQQLQNCKAGYFP